MVSLPGSDLTGSIYTMLYIIACERQHVLLAITKTASLRLRPRASWLEIDGTCTVLPLAIIKQQASGGCLRYAQQNPHNSAGSLRSTYAAHPTVKHPDMSTPGVT
mmetsp:Transcript_5609/g.12426  ORF Transcript_5609/g.12426 Transcript_5609/m.12426 type:complete len:105 (+) Transcript_5609:566-880(+)